jgi:glycine/D-amino acid oxidase-like deaminating enzyme
MKTEARAVVIGGGVVGVVDALSPGEEGLVGCRS